jgi:glyoxylase-like metal-dependent hydrolase (beta-lactamase superfamily II)
VQRLTVLALGLVVLASQASCARQAAGTLEGAAGALRAGEMRSIEYSGTGRWFQFGQAPNPTLPWPAFDVSRFTATVDYETPAARVQIIRRQVVEPGRVRPAPVEQRPVQIVSGAYAWNMAVPAGSPAGAAPAPQPQPAAVAERTMEIWSTPHGFLRAAAANGATSEVVDGGSQITFTLDGKYRYVGRIDARNQLEHVETWIDNPVLGDTRVEITYSDYRDFDGVLFPSRIVRSHGGHPVLDLTVSAVTANPPAEVDVPGDVRRFTPAPVTVAVDRLANGVYYMRGGSHHSVAVEQRDHIVVVEAPLNEERAEAVIAKVKETIPDKPIRYVVNTHLHFDHSGGLRTYVAEGATVVTHEMNRPYFEAAWTAPRTIAPDRLARTGTAATFETVGDRHVLTDGRRTIEVHRIAGGGHDDAFLMVYLPAERILIEGDAYSPTAAGVPPPPTANPFSVNLAENIARLKLDVRQIAALHGPRVVTLADLLTAIRGDAAN